ncbi:MAG TPA: hypothetical protein VJ672_11625 [Gemmatimonadaceae bacterium]|nr:hypothetical protein [Gemmatimonadaceae bacterium]
MAERRFNESEVAAIFERATETRGSGTRLGSSGDGMTLAELQDIGREVGISSDAIALAAQSIDQAPSAPLRFLGLPLGVSRTANLGRKLSDEEWERLVVDLRETFNARGVVRKEGSLRQWTNGNLQALLEPTETGQRLRLRTVKGNAPPMMAAGFAMVALSIASFVIAALRGGPADPGMLLGMGILGAAGLGMFASAALRLPGWARTRERQMEEIAARAALTAGTPRTQGE